MITQTNGERKLSAQQRLLDYLLKGARPLGMSWKDFRESRTKKAPPSKHKLSERFE